MVTSQAGYDESGIAGAEETIGDLCSSILEQPRPQTGIPFFKAPERISRRLLWSSIPSECAWPQMNTDKTDAARHVFRTGRMRET
jgi:hypothetical protein